MNSYNIKPPPSLSETERDCLRATEALLQELQTLDYKVIVKKVQLCTSEAAYLRYGGKRSPPQGRVAAWDPSDPSPKGSRIPRCSWVPGLALPSLQLPTRM